MVLESDLIASCLLRRKQGGGHGRDSFEMRLQKVHHRQEDFFGILN